MCKAFVFIFYISAALVFNRCSTIAKKVYGAKKPRIENEQSVLDFLRNNDLPTEEVVTVDTTGFFYFFPSFAQAPLLFEKTGKFRAAGFANGKYCPKGIDVYLSHVNSRQETFNKPDSFIVRESFFIPPNEAKKLRLLNKITNEQVKEIRVITKDTIKMNFYKLNELFYSLNGSKKGIIQTSDYDFILILPFAKFYGNKLQVKDLKKYYRSAINNSNAKFKIVFLNLDKQSWWGKEANDRINIFI